jgi:hypothetical protein
MQTSTIDAPNRTALSRWIGALAGLVACAATALAAGVVFVLADPDGWASGNGFLTSDSLVWIAIGGLPIAFFGGRALLPAARSGGWLTALAIGFVFGLIAPPLGAIEVILVGLLPFSGATSGFDDNVTGFLVILPIALVYSYVVVVLTVPAGLLWALIVRAIPERRAG